MISLFNIYGARTKIEQLNSDHPNWGLGCLIAPSGQQDIKFTKKRDQLLPLASSVNRTYISTHYTWTLLHTHIIPRIAYSFPTTLLSNKQCTTLNAIIDGPILNKLHINQHFPKKVLYHSHARRGLNFPSF